MKTIIIKTQAELDALPDAFTEYTVIEIRSPKEINIVVNKARESSTVVARESSRVEARESSRVEAWGSSRVEAWESSTVVAWGSSTVVAWESSTVEAHDFSTVQMLSILVTLTLFNYAIASVRGFKPKTKIVVKNKTATIITTPEKIKHSFKEWLSQGYVHADGITKKLLSKKKIGSLEVFEVEEFLDRSSSFVVKKGELFSHGKTIKEAKDSLKYKLSNRDVSEYKKWKLTDTKTLTDLIGAYRAITGACEFGTREFCEGKKFPAKITIKKAIELTAGKYGNEKFGAFFLSSKRG